MYRFQTANQEKEHAKRLFKYLKSGEGVELTVTFPAGKIGTTIENLKEAAGGENFEWTEMYPSFAKTAKEEGFDKISETFTAIAVAEKYHENRYNLLCETIVDGTVFKKTEIVEWRCRNCGYLYEGLEAPEVCPACSHAQVHFEVFIEKY